MHESNVYSLYKPPCLFIVGSLSGCPSSTGEIQLNLK